MLTPWSRSPKIPPGKSAAEEPDHSPLHLEDGSDHIISTRHRLSFHLYPQDCPTLRPQWFHAVDVPKRRPHPAGEVKSEKPAVVPKKYAAFSTRDSKAIEAAYQKLAKEEDVNARAKLEKQREESSWPYPDKASWSDNQSGIGFRTETVPVNEDYLFDVDVGKRELTPAYWLGPVYDVRRGTWFFKDGSIQRPCDENLAAQLEEGYLKVKPWRISPTETAQLRSRSASQTRSRSASSATKLAVPDSTSSEGFISNLSNPGIGRGPEDDTGRTATRDGGAISQGAHPQNTHRLFGAYMNSIVTYQDATTAWLLTDDFMSRMNFSMYQRFAGGGHLGGVKLTRGYVSQEKKLDANNEKSAVAQDVTQNTAQDETQKAADQTQPGTSETPRQSLQRQMSSLLEDPSGEDPAKREEERRQRDEREIEDDYREMEGDDQGREIEHLILVTHGIGQRLGLRLDSVNFVHDVNTLRKTIKAVYAESPDLRALNAELDNAESVNSRVQVLPICWRHLLDFPKQSLRHNRKERDLTDDDFDDQDYPSLEDITVEGVPAVRNLLTDLAFDILLYDAPAYKDHITSIVLDECNKTYRLFLERNPEFKGKISFIGHSLGSAIMFDILCRQGEPNEPKLKGGKSVKLDFEVEDFYALGSPIGLFQMLAGRTIAARASSPGLGSRWVGSSMDDPMLDDASTSRLRESAKSPSWAENPVSRPRCAQLFNIFHPTDPISYRIEPLISPAMASLKPQPLPYTKRGIFGAPVGQGFTGIGTRVSQSVSSMWSSMASNFLTRGLGYSGDESLKTLRVGQSTVKSSSPLSMAKVSRPPTDGEPNEGPPGAKAPAIGPLPPEGAAIAKVSDDEQIRRTDDSRLEAEGGQRPQTLIDAELETLYGGFEKRRKSIQSDAETRDLGAGTVKDTPEWAEAGERGKRLRREEAKVRKLNSNGRVDYSIQEGAFDINLIAAIASHLSYWSDEDVCHFITSQLLSRSRVVLPRATGGRRMRASSAVDSIPK